MFTASSVLLQSLCDAGIAYAFVNWGSDHPALLADLERQRSSASTTNGDGTKVKPTVVTCPNEMVALSAAQGYAQVTGKPALVIVHVDVGTQALAGAVHNVDRCRAPVIIYAGASPYSTSGEHKGTRNEWIMWLQDVPDQPSIVRQYMRYSAQLHSALTIPGVVRRSIQIASSEPRGPVYLWARREVMEQELPPTLFEDVTRANSSQQWPILEPPALSAGAALRIGTALVEARHPLIITSHVGRNPRAVGALVSLSALLAIPILPVCPSVVCVPHSHPYGLAPTYLNATPKSVPTTAASNLSGGVPAPESAPAAREIADHLSQADVILIVDSDLSWIPGNGQGPPQGTQIFVLDGGDPLKTTVQMGWWRGEAAMICRADAEVALGQISDVVVQSEQTNEGRGIVEQRARGLREEWEKRVQDVEVAELDYRTGVPGSSPSSTYTVPNILGVLREGIRDLTPSRGDHVLVLNETITNFQFIWEHMRPEVPGSLLTSGGSSLGWALGAAVGASLAGRAAASVGYPPEGAVSNEHELIVAVVGDGSYMFGIPSSAYWMARRYETPFLTIILNNGGWRAPKLSMLSVHPIGHNNELLSSVPGDALSVGFGPICPDYSQIAVAASAGWAWGARVGGRMGSNGVFNGDARASLLSCRSPSTSGLEDNTPEVSSSIPQDGGKAFLEEAIRKGIEMVVKEKRCAVIDCFLDGI